MAESWELCEDLLHVPDVINKIRKNDGVKGPFEYLQIVTVRLDKRDVRMQHPGTLNHLRRKIDAYAF
jgi:hypothetical protein